MGHSREATRLGAAFVLALVAACATAGKVATAESRTTIASAAVASSKVSGTPVPAPFASESASGAPPDSTASAEPRAPSQPAAVMPDVDDWATPQPVVDKMLELAQVKASDVVYDLGCGDARSLITAAERYGA